MWLREAPQVQAQCCMSCPARSFHAPLMQTDNCLRQLAARLQASGAGDALLATHAGTSSPPATATGMGSPAGAGTLAEGSTAGANSIAALEQSHEAWSKLAQAFEADVQEQPRLLTGGARSVQD